jgi:hypothetical protein
MTMEANNVSFTVEEIKPLILPEEEETAAVKNMNDEEHKSIHAQDAETAADVIPPEQDASDKTEQRTSSPKAPTVGDMVPPEEDIMPYNSSIDFIVPVEPKNTVAMDELKVATKEAVVSKPPVETTRAKTRPQYKSVESNDDTKPGLLSLPIDSLHWIASFLTPTEWGSVGETGRAANRVYREIVRRVRMHGFRCATEIVTAWKLGHHADARELSALYIQAGVPVYPRSLGHSYHTLIWRMGVEASVIQEQEAEKDNETSSDETVSSRMDSYYTERSEFRAREGRNPHITYLEEKSIFWMSKTSAEFTDAIARLSFFPFDPRSRNMTSHTGADLSAPRPSATPTVSKDRPSVPLPKISLWIHQHLYDQHILGKICVDDQEGSMVTPPVSLSADFFHPALRSSLTVAPIPEPNETEGETSDLLLTEAVRGNRRPAAVVGRPLREEVGEIRVAHVPNLPQAPVIIGEGRAPHQLAVPVPDLVVANNPEELLEAHEDDIDAAHFEPPPPLSEYRLQAILQHLDLDMYTSSMVGNSKSDVVDGSLEMKRHLRSRLATYQRRLEALLAQCDNKGFEESILDFWDEFFPQSTMIQYFDLHTAVPRISSLDKFLTRPCPKALGTIQCEIERIKITPRGKGVSMKGRLFPTYEYRLFIRDRSSQSTAPESAVVEEDNYTRRDTVLMVARNKGRKYANASGVMQATSSSKKGSNNYYLHLPEQSDVDSHCNTVNETEEETKLNPNGVSHGPITVSDDAASPLLGRLQSNFIGTEFEIFTPRLRKRTRHRVPINSPSDDEGYDSGVSSDNTSGRRRFGRLSFRRGIPASTENPTGNGLSEVSTAANHAKLKRTNSCPDLPAPQGRLPRPSRRAIANTPENQEPVLCEEEDGVITYTANLLGSRPRIMDVCVPTVTPDGVAGGVWKQYLDTFDVTDECHMLNSLRQLQVLHDNREQNIAEANQVDNVNDNATVRPIDTFGLLAMQNRPPWWNIELGSFVLNFGGRVSVASVKNFQLCDRNDQGTIMLQFGRIQGRHSFTMDYQHPLTAVQAFSIAISSLQSKISFG